MPNSPLRWILGSGLLLAMTLAVYLPTYLPVYPNHSVAGFVWDDDKLVVNNPNIRSLHGLWEAWFDPANHGRFYPDYYPLTYTSWWVEYQIAGINPQLNHFDNVLLHALNAILLWIILTRLGIAGGWVAAAIFAVHPIQVESVAWVSERKNVLSGCFFLLSAWMFIEAWKLPSPSGRGWRVPTPGEGVADQGTTNPDSSLAAKASNPPTLDWPLLALSLFFYVLAMFAKPVTMTLAGALPLVLWWRRSRLGWRELAAAIPYVMVALPMAGLTMWFQRHHIALLGQEPGYSVAARCLIAGRVAWFYAGKLFWPMHLSFAYAKWRINPAIWWQWLFPLGGLAILAMLWLGRRAWGLGPVIAVLFFIVTLAPALGFVPILWHRYYFVADHVQYLACIGLIVLAAAGATRCSRDWRPGVRFGAGCLTALLLTSLGFAACRQSLVYQNTFALWSDVLAKDPNSPLGHVNLAVAYLQQHKVKEALPLLERAVELDPDLYEAQFNLGLLLYNQGRLQQAIPHLRAALAAKPMIFNTLAGNILGTALAKLGELDAAEAQFNQVLDRSPDDSRAHNGLGEVLHAKGESAPAFEQFQMAAILDPGAVSPHLNMAGVLLELQQYNAAATQYRVALKLQPHHADIEAKLEDALEMREKASTEPAGGPAGGRN